MSSGAVAVQRPFGPEPNNPNGKPLPCPPGAVFPLKPALVGLAYQAI